MCRKSERFWTKKVIAVQTSQSGIRKLVHPLWYRSWGINSSLCAMSTMKVYPVTNRSENSAELVSCVFIPRFMWCHEMFTIPHQPYLFKCLNQKNSKGTERSLISLSLFFNKLCHIPSMFYSSMFYKNNQTLLTDLIFALSFTLISAKISVKGHLIYKRH